MDLLKNLDNMITAEEFLKDKFRKIYLSHPESFKDKISEKIYLELHVTGRVNGTEQNYPEMMIEFAKLHVEAAKKEYHKVLVKQGIVTEAGIGYFDNAYSLDNIK